MTRRKDELIQTNKHILEEIQKVRVKMIDSAEKNGFIDESTIRYSQELDQLIFEYQSKIHINPPEQKEKKYVLNKMIVVWPKSLLASVNLLH